MKFPTAFFTLFLTLAVVNASSNLHDRSLGARNWHSRRHTSVGTSHLEKKSLQKRCSRRGDKSTTTSSTQKHTSKAPEKTSASKPPHSSNHDSNNASKGGSSSGGNILVASSDCGPSNAVPKTTTTSGPNGSIEFLNCGIDSKGWNPPQIDISKVIVKPLSDAIKSSSSPFKACEKYVDMFNKYGGEYGIPPIFLASFAMQESSCKPETVGGAGEQGLMQITKDKCGGAPNGNCRDPNFNIRTGAKYFADTLKDVGGNLPEAIGRYNGWYKGLTVSKAKSAKDNGCCRCQQNLDYLHQFLNGWCQNMDPYEVKLGLYFNLNVCPT